MNNIYIIITLIIKNIQFPNFNHLPVNGRNLETIHMKSTFKNGLQNDLRAIRNLRAKTDLIREINIIYYINQNLYYGLYYNLLYFKFYLITISTQSIIINLIKVYIIFK